MCYSDVLCVILISFVTYESDCYSDSQRWLLQSCLEDKKDLVAVVKGKVYLLSGTLCNHVTVPASMKMEY